MVKIILKLPLKKPQISEKFRICNLNLSIRTGLKVVPTSVSEKCLGNFSRFIDFPVINIFRFYRSGTGWMQIVISMCDRKTHLLCCSIFKQYMEEKAMQLFPSKKCFLHSSVKEDTFLPLSSGSSFHALTCEQELGWSNCRLWTFGLLENSFFWEVVGSQINTDTGFKDYNLSASGRSREGEEERKVTCIAL